MTGLCAILCGVIRKMAKRDLSFRHEGPVTYLDLKCLRNFFTLTALST